MAKNNYSTPRIFAIITGIIAFLILLVAFFSLGQVVKGFGSIFLFLPDKLGVIQTPVRAEIAEVDLAEPDTVLSFSKPGLYTVYTVDYELLVLNDQLIEAKAEPWLGITSQASGAPVKVDYVERGMRLYDTPLIKGRPIHTLYIETPGTYQITHINKDVSIYFLPDYVTGNEDLFTLSILAQFAVLAIIAGVFYQRGARKRAAKVKEVMQLKKIQQDASNHFWKDYQGKSAKDKSKKNYWR
jgi:hypothetical protein